MTTTRPKASASGENTTAEPSVNGLAWWFGWHPAKTVLGLTVAGVVVGTFVDALVLSSVVGPLAGLTVWYWGVREVNGNYEAYEDWFTAKSERAAERGVLIDDGTSHSLTSFYGESPLLIEPLDTFCVTVFTMADTSVNVNEGAEYDMRSLDGVDGGKDRELFYDQISAVESRRESGGRSRLDVRLPGSEDLVVDSNDTETVEAIVTQLRRRVREAKR